MLDIHVALQRCALARWRERERERERERGRMSLSQTPACLTPPSLRWRSMCFLQILLMNFYRLS